MNAVVEILLNEMKRLMPIIYIGLVTFLACLLEFCRNADGAMNRYHLLAQLIRICTQAATLLFGGHPHLRLIAQSAMD